MQSRAWVARVRGAKVARCALLRQPLACSWRSLSTCNTTTVVALSLHRRARRTSSSFRLSFLVFSLSLRFSLETILVSAGALLSLLSSLIWSLVSALLSAAVLLLSLPALSSRLLRFCLSSASATLMVRRVVLYTLQYSIPSEDYGIQWKTFPKTFCDPPQ